jgi:uncharacterized protein (TIGR00255 family)
MRSMTGFGRGQVGQQGRRLTVEVRSVNHRFLDMKVRLPWADVGVEASIAEAVRMRLERGRVEVLVREQGTGLVPGWLAEPGRARALVEALTALQRELGMDEPLRLEHLLAVGEQMTGEPDQDSDTRWRQVEPALRQALDALEQMRRTEGAALEKDLRARITHVRALVVALGVRLPLALNEATRRLAERVHRLLGQVAAEAGVNTAPVLDAGRLAQEVALLADRTDVTEELTRLESHLAQMEGRCAVAEPVGRQLDFLLQELSREVNTIGSKAQDAEVGRLVVELKGELEKMREQVQNVE